MNTPVNKNTTITPEEIREWEMKIGRFEGFDTEITHYLKYCGRVVPQTKDIIPRYHQSLPDLMRVLNKFENYLLYKSGKDFHCQISGDKSKIIWEPIQEEAIFNAIIRNITNVETE